MKLIFYSSSLIHESDEGNDFKHLVSQYFHLLKISRLTLICFPARTVNVIKYKTDSNDVFEGNVSMTAADQSQLFGPLFQREVTSISYFN